MTAALRLDLGAGNVRIPGFTPVDAKTGQQVYPLAYADDSVDEIRASHVLEHFSHTQTRAVLKDWVRVLKPGCFLRVAVPNFDWIVDQYRAYPDGDLPLEAYVMGGHVDDADVHGAIFNAAKLTELLTEAGLMDIHHWTSAVQDCASLPVSLNLVGTKPMTATIPPRWKPEVTQDATPEIQRPFAAAVMSVPRLCFSDNMFAVFSALVPLGIPLRSHTGAYWGQTLTRVLEQTLAEDDPRYVITLDYDSIFTKEDVAWLIRHMEEHPEFDALVPIQLKREANAPLCTLINPDGTFRESTPVEELKQQEFLPLGSGHFGLTILRAAKLAVLPKPWFHSQPGPDGRWAEGRLDEDMHFWKVWREAGNNIHLVRNVSIGHLQLGGTWITKDWKCKFQHTSEYRNEGKPKEV